MSPTDWIALGSLVLAVVSLLVGLSAQARASKVSEEVALLQAEQTRVAAKMLEIERRRDERETQALTRAELRPSLIRTGAPGGLRFVVANAGAGAAREIFVEFDGQSHEERCGWMGRTNRLTTSLPPGHEVSYTLATSNVCRRPERCRVRWTDDSGKRGEWDGPLTT